MKKLVALSRKALTGSALLLAMSNCNSASAKELIIQNDLNVDLHFTGVLNRQNFKIKSSPPKVVKAGTADSFNAGYNRRYYKNIHLKVEYAAGWSESTDRVNFGLRQTKGRPEQLSLLH